MTARLIATSAVSLALAAALSAQEPVQTTTLQSSALPTTQLTIPDPAAAAAATTTTTEPAKPAARAERGTSGTSLAEARLVESATTEFQIGPEDVLDISVWKNPDLSRSVVPVRPDGKISLPLINDVQAAGLTPTELREKLATQLGDYVPSPEVSVMVREVHSRKIAVVGAVKAPNRFEMKSTATVLEAIAMAGGFGDFAQRDKIVVIRQDHGKTTRLPFNYRKVSEGSEQDNFLLRPGDIIVVP